MYNSVFLSIVKEFYNCYHSSRTFLSPIEEILLSRTLIPLPFVPRNLKIFWPVKRYLNYENKDWEDLWWYDCFLEVTEKVSQCFWVAWIVIFRKNHFIKIFYKTSNLHASIYQIGHEDLKSEIQWSKPFSLWSKFVLNTYGIVFNKT